MCTIISNAATTMAIKHQCAWYSDFANEKNNAAERNDSNLTDLGISRSILRSRGERNEIPLPASCAI